MSGMSDHPPYRDRDIELSRMISLGAWLAHGTMSVLLVGGYCV
jgi:hypothetical protein